MWTVLFVSLLCLLNAFDLLDFSVFSVYFNLKFVFCPKLLSKIVVFRLLLCFPKTFNSFNFFVRIHG